MTKLELPGRNQLYAMQLVHARHSFLEARGWHAESLQRLILDKAGVEVSCITQFTCSKLTHLEMRAFGPTFEEDTIVKLPSLEAFPLLEKLKLHDFALMDQGCLWKPFTQMKRSVIRATLTCLVNSQACTMHWNVSCRSLNKGIADGFELCMVPKKQYLQLHVLHGHGFLGFHRLLVLLQWTTSL